jgi:Spy/CpxP family protein refolding chaperone
MNGSRLSAIGARLIFAAALFVAPCTVIAQEQRPPDGPPPQRARLEGEIRRTFARAVRERVGLSDEQMRRLAPLTQNHEQQRRRLQQEERTARVALQTQLRSDAPDTAAVSRLLDTLLDVQRRRMQMIEAEHRDLATVMSPVQRARYLGLQEQVRRRMEQMRQGPPPGAPGGEGGNRPGRRRPPT